jgi:hypothetical protein
MLYRFFLVNTETKANVVVNNSELQHATRWQGREAEHSPPDVEVKSQGRYRVGGGGGGILPAYL